MKISADLLDSGYAKMFTFYLAPTCSKPAASLLVLCVSDESEFHDILWNTENVELSWDSLNAQEKAKELAKNSVQQDSEAVDIAV